MSTLKPSNISSGDIFYDTFMKQHCLVISFDDNIKGTKLSIKYLYIPHRINPLTYTKDFLLHVDNPQRIDIEAAQNRWVKTEFKLHISIEE